MSTEAFDHEAGELCLDFANTVEWHAGDQPEDKLADCADLIRWGEAAGILPAGRSEQLRQAAEDEDAARATFMTAIRLREAIYRIFAAIANDEPVAAPDLTLLNDHLGLALPNLKIVASNSEFTWAWRERSGVIEQVMWAVARSAGNLLTGDTLNRVGQCADDRGCGYLFVDNSRNRSRRWCSMESCGNRAKVHRHYRRQREDGSQKN